MTTEAVVMKLAAVVVAAVAGTHVRVTETMQVH
jgi:hypothetical protein